MFYDDIIHDIYTMYIEIREAVVLIPHRYMNNRRTARDFHLAFIFSQAYAVCCRRHNTPSLSVFVRPAEPCTIVSRIRTTAASAPAVPTTTDRPSPRLAAARRPSSRRQPHATRPHTRGPRGPHSGAVTVSSPSCCTCTRPVRPLLSRRRRGPTMYAVIQLDSENHRLRPKRVKMEFVCKYCNRTFNKHYSLLIHERNHMPAVNYRCEMCYKSFKRQDSLQQHRSVSKSH